MLLCRRAFPFLCLILAGAASAQNSTTAGEFTAEPPTLVSLGFEWRITGDDNRNAKVEASFRKRGESTWRPALPLMRLQREEIGTAPGPNSANDPARYPLFRYTAANMFAGSILNLDPGTEYECRFVLSDPDGVKGKAEKTVFARTRQEPQAAAGGHVY